MDRDKYSLNKHPKFGFGQICPTPGQDEIDRFYAEEFYSTDYPQLNNSALDEQILDQEFHRAHRQDMADTLCELFGETLSGKSILDIGCGWAQTLLHFREQGADCYGFDPAEEAARYGSEQGLPIVRAGMESVDVFDGKRFDVVLLLNVLEHLRDPVAVLQEIHTKVIRPGGVLLIEVPNDFNVFQTCGRSVHGLEQWWVAPPAHLNYFDSTSLRALVSGTGFRPETIEGSFPLEAFLLFGDNYVEDRKLGRACHEKRMAFERNLRRHGHADVLRKFYRSLADLNLGRQVTVYAISE